MGKMSGQLRYYVTCIKRSGRELESRRLVSAAEIQIHKPLAKERLGLLGEGPCKATTLSKIPGTDQFLIEFTDPPTKGDATIYSFYLVFFPPNLLG